MQRKRYRKTFLRFCKQCHDGAKATKTLKIVMAMVREGRWICPFRKAQCGRIIHDAS